VGHWGRRLRSRQVQTMASERVQGSPPLASNPTRVHSSEIKRDLVTRLFDIGAVKLGGEWKLKSGILSPVYVDLRLTVSHPEVLDSVATSLVQSLTNASPGLAYDLICGVPYTALPFATAVSLQTRKPMVMRRKEAKDYGTKKIIEGDFGVGQRCLIVEDLVTSGLSVMETVEPLEAVGLQVSDVVVLLDRQQGGRENLSMRGIKLHAVLTMNEVLDILQNEGKITEQVAASVRSFLQDNQMLRPMEIEQPQTPKSYTERAGACRNPVGAKLLRLMDEKRTNLAVAADVETEIELLTLAESIGSEICILKTHADIITDWNPHTGEKLREIAERHKFLIFEDRKFADIGHTVQMQASSGVHRILHWADIINAHPVPGPGIIHGLEKASLQCNRSVGLLLLAQMSSAGNLASSLKGYADMSVDMAKNNESFTFGFISMERISGDNFVYMTPGVQMDALGDSLGQQYQTPAFVIEDRKSDVIIVGRGIYKADNPRAVAQQYREAAWAAYQRRITNQAGQKG